MSSCPCFYSLLLYKTPGSLQLSAATSLAQPRSQWPPGSSCLSQAGGKAGSAYWSFHTSTSGRASRPMTHRSKHWLLIQQRTASSVDRLRGTLRYFHQLYFHQRDQIHFSGINVWCSERCIQERGQRGLIIFEYMNIFLAFLDAFRVGWKWGAWSIGEF